MCYLYFPKKKNNQICFHCFLEHKTIFNVLLIFSLFFHNKKTVLKNYIEIALVLKTKIKKDNGIVQQSCSSLVSTKYQTKRPQRNPRNNKNNV